MEFIDLTVKKVGSDDTFQYHCFRCGECCHNVKDAIMLSSFDLFRLAKFLDRNPEEVIENYAVPMPMSEFNFPLLMLKTKQYGDACVFYKNGCSVQDAKPLVCRLYPMNVGPVNLERPDDLEYFIVSQKPHHYTGETHRVGDWMDANFTPDDRRFTVEWYKRFKEFGNLMRDVGKSAPDKAVGTEKIKRLLGLVLWWLYFCYDTQKDFWPQYERNMDALKRDMEAAAKDVSRR